MPILNGPSPPDIPPSHFKNVIGYPSFVLYESAAWNAALRDRNYPLAGNVYNGRPGPNGRAVKAITELPYTADNITRWAANLGGRTQASAASVPAANSYAYNCSNLSYVNPRYSPR